MLVVHLEKLRERVLSYELQAEYSLAQTYDRVSYIESTYAEDSPIAGEDKGNISADGEKSAVGEGGVDSTLIDSDPSETEKEVAQ